MNNEGIVFHAGGSGVTIVLSLDGEVVKGDKLSQLVSKLNEDDPKTLVVKEALKSIIQDL